jgi:hypothetical protein
LETPEEYYVFCPLDNRVKCGYGAIHSCAKAFECRILEQVCKHQSVNGLCTDEITILRFVHESVLVHCRACGTLAWAGRQHTFGKLKIGGPAKFRTFPSRTLTLGTPLRRRSKGRWDKMNGAETLISARNVTIEDDPEPGDPPPRPPSPPSRKLSPSPAQQTSSHQISPSPQVIDLDTPASDEPEFMSQLAYTNALIRQATMPILPHDLEDFGIPPSPPGTPDPTLSQKLQNFRQLRDRGVYFNDRLGGNRGFRNPKLLEKLRGYAGIEDEYGSHLPLSTWNPHGFQEDQYYDRLGISLIFWVKLTI